MPTAATAAERYTLRLDDAEWQALNRTVGLTIEAAQADNLGFSRATLNRIRQGRCAPGPEFIAAVRRSFPDADIARLFPTVLKAAPGRVA